jgi:hypothetical protein
MFMAVGEETIPEVPSCVACAAGEPCPSTGGSDARLIMGETTGVFIRISGGIASSFSLSFCSSR